MGRLDQLAKQTFAEETEKITDGAAAWISVPEIGLTEVRGDGLLLIRDPQRLRALAPPWPEACEHDEILIELKMPGDHLDQRAIERTLLRRQARQVQRFEDPGSLWIGQEPVWLVAPVLPSLLETFATCTGSPKAAIASPRALSLSCGSPPTSFPSARSSSPSSSPAQGALWSSLLDGCCGVALPPGFYAC